MKARILSFTLLALIVYCFACTNTDEAANSFKEYYYPLDALKVGKTYQYEVVGQENIAPDYWFYRYIATDTADYLMKAFYQQNDFPTQVAREEIVSNGVLINQLHLFEADSTGKILQEKADILSANVFPFEIDDPNTVYLYKVNFKYPSQEHGNTSLIINRHFLGDTTFTFEGKNYPAIRFDMRGQALVQDTINGGIEPRFWGQEIYAKGLGLVAYRQTFDPNDPGLEYRLTKRFDGDAFQE